MRFSNGQLQQRLPHKQLARVKDRKAVAPFVHLAGFAESPLLVLGLLDSWLVVVVCCIQIARKIPAAAPMTLDVTSMSDA